MPDLKKVINALECISNGAKQPCRDCEYSKREEWCIAECAKDALTLLKAQEQVRPERSCRGTCWYYCCGNCGKPLDPGDPYCRGCGRAVKWDG